MWINIWQNYVIPRSVGYHFWLLYRFNCCTYTWRQTLTVYILRCIYSRIYRVCICFSCFDSRPGFRPAVWGFFITHSHTTFVRTSLDRWSALCRDLYLIAHNTHERQTSMPAAGFEPAIPTSERPQAHASVRVKSKVWVHLLNSFGRFQALVNTLMKFWFS